ncbi:MAG: peptidylprolyl isomerase [Planctomycetota bacterium]
MSTLWITSLAISGTIVASPVQQGPALPGVNPPGVQQIPGSPNPTAPPRPTLSPEELASRFAESLTGLAGRVNSLRRLANLGDPSGEAPKPPAGTIDAIRRILGDITREIHLRAHPIELKVAGSTAESLASPAARSIPAASIKTAPEMKRTAITNVNITTTQGPGYPAIDASKADQIVYRVGGVEIRRGEIDNIVLALAKFQPETNLEFHGAKAVRGGVLPRALRKSSLPEGADAIVQKAKSLRDEIASGKRTFEDAARELSDDPSTKPFGGLCDGWKPSLLQPLELAVMASMKPGEISEPFMMTSGMEFIQLIEIKQNAAKPSDSEIRMRRIILSFNLPNNIATLTKAANVEVLVNEFEHLLPDQIQRTKRTQ